MKNVRKGFFDELFVLVLPIVFQNLITSAVTMADVIMLGRVDQVSLSASSLAGQVQFLLSIVYFGLASALTILASQYWGKQDKKIISKIFAIGLIISLLFSVSAFLGALFIPHLLIRFWTNVPELIDAGAVYLRYAALSYFFAGISQPYLAILKSCERVKKATAISVTSFLSNLVLNALLIFGLLGFPQMGIAGAALATSLSRGIELILCLWDYRRTDTLIRNIPEMFRIPRELISDFIRYSLPAFVNDAIWAFAYNMNSVIMGHLGSDIVAASSVVNVVRELITTVGFGISSASAIMLGKEIGENLISRAEQDASSIYQLCWIVSGIQGLLLLAISPFVPGFVVISDTAKEYLKIMLYISTVYQAGQIINTLLISSFFRCGGDSRYGLMLDTISMWGVAVPLGLISAFVLKLPPIIVYALMCTDEFVKLPAAIFHYKKGGWIRNLTREFS